MNHLNNSLLEGILVADPKRIDLSDAPEGCRLVKFDMASDRYYVDRGGKKAVETLFIAVQCWGSLGDRCIEKMSKGMTARVVGRLRLCRWQSSDGGSRKSIRSGDSRERRGRTGTYGRTRGSIYVLKARREVVLLPWKIPVA